MKAITCASYDYMKVMVTELQKQVDELTGYITICSILTITNICTLTELERLQKLGLSSIPGATVPPPAVPPRQRHNPFNLIERQANTINSISQKVAQKQNFTCIHAAFGQQIIKDREEWQKAAKELNSKSNLVIKEDVLITL